MNCPICHITFDSSRSSVCPQCHFDANSPDAKDTAKVLAAREAFKSRVSAYAPESRVTRCDIAKPWLAVIIGFCIFLIWLKACSNAGGRMMSFGRHSFYRHH